MPEHDLEPPRFSRRAFERLLSDWPAVKGMIMTGTIQNLYIGSRFETEAHFGAIRQVGKQEKD